MKHSAVGYVIILALMVAIILTDKLGLFEKICLDLMVMMLLSLWSIEDRLNE